MHRTRLTLTPPLYILSVCLLLIMTAELEAPPTPLSELRLQAINEITFAARLWIEEQAPLEVELRSVSKTVASFCRNMSFAKFVFARSHSLIEFLDRTDGIFTIKKKKELSLASPSSPNLFARRTFGLYFSRNGANSTPASIDSEAPWKIAALMKESRDPFGQIRLQKRTVELIASLTPLDILTALEKKLSASNG